MFTPCVTVFGGRDVCNPGKSVNSGFGKGYVYLTKSKDELKREFLNVKVNYKLNKVKIMVMRPAYVQRFEYLLFVQLSITKSRCAVVTINTFSLYWATASFLAIPRRRVNYFSEKSSDDR